MFFTEQKSVISEGVLQPPAAFFRDIFTALIARACIYSYCKTVHSVGQKQREPHLDGCTDKKEFLIYKEIQSGAVAKSYMRKGFLIYEEMRKYFPVYEEAVSHI
jgi:hypothetical protein